MSSISSQLPATDPAANSSASQSTASTDPASQNNSAANDFRQLFASSLPPAVPFSATNPPLPYGYPGPGPEPSASTGSNAAGSNAAGASASDATFVPVFQDAVVTDGVNSWNLNHDYFATQQTAQWIADKYGTGKIISTPFEGTGGPFNANQTEFQIVLADGRTVNAGILAGYYERNPPSQFPGLADQLIRSQLRLNSV